MLIIFSQCARFVFQVFSNITRAVLFHIIYNMAARTVAVDSVLLRRIIGVGIGGNPSITRIRSASILHESESDPNCNRRVINIRSELEVSRATVPELRGHFPGVAILPAIVMLEAIFQSAAASTAVNDVNVHLDVRRIKSATFRKPIVGLGSILELTVDQDIDSDAGIRTFRATVKERKSDEIVADVQFSATQTKIDIIDETTPTKL